MKKLASENNVAPYDYIIMNWADDINYLVKDVEVAKKVIGTLKAVAEELILPFSKDKCKMVAMYPQRYPRRKKIKIGTVLDELVTVSKEAKILGLKWSQPRFYKGKAQLFQANADEAIEKVRAVKSKLARLKYHTKNINRTTQNILLKTYLFGKVRYGMTVMWDLIPITRRR